MSSKSAAFDTHVDEAQEPRNFAVSPRDSHIIERELHDVNHQLAQAYNRNEILVRTLQEAREQVIALKEETFPDIAEVATLTIGATLRRWTHPATILRRPTINERSLDPQLIRVNRHVSFLRRFTGVSDSRTHALLDAVSRTLIRKLQNRQSLIDVLAANHIYDEPRLLRRPALVFCTRYRFHLLTSVLRTEY